MKILLAVVLTLAALYSGYWLVTVRALDAGLDRAITLAEDRGWQVEIGSRETHGFPSRFDVTVQDVTVTSPTGRLVWQAPVVQTAALSYAPNRVIATLPPAQTLVLDGRPATVGSDGLRASLHLAASSDLGVQAVTAETRSLDMVFDSGRRLRGGAALAALRLAEGTTSDYELHLDAADLSLEVADLDLPRPGALSFDGTVTTDRPLGRQTLSRPARLERLVIDRLTLDAGPVGLSVAGMLDVDAAGFPVGTLTVETADWREIVQILVGLGVVPDGMQDMLRTALLFLGSGATDTVRLPLVFENRRMALGPLPLGPAPRLR